MTDAELLKNLTDHDRKLNDFAFRSFRNIADGDYIAARLAYRAQLPVQFLWACQQAIEKYLKCILFIRRIKQPDRLGHNLAPSLKLVEDAGLGFELRPRSRDFIRRIDEVGRFRYMEVSFTVNWNWVMVLDQAVWELRRSCTLDPKVTCAKLVENKWAPRVRITGGHLEKILDNRENPAREHLLWHNSFWGRGRRTVILRGSFISINSPLFNYPELPDDILKYAFIPCDVVKAYREYAAEKAKEVKKSP